MFFITISIFCFTFLQILVEIQSASDQPDVDGYDVAGTERAIRNTMNNLFSTLKLKDMDQKLKLKQHSTIHNFFTSLTLQDHDNLKEIARLTKVHSLDNSTKIFITQLNEVLNEDYKSDEETDAVYITNLIEGFLENLDNLKEIYGLKNNDANLNINKDVIKHLDKNENECENGTLIKNRNNSHEDILSENEFWQPSARRIYEGHTVKIDRFPFMASVQFFKKFQCVGSIIKSDLVITSASCLQLAWNNRFFRENPGFLSVQVGSSYYEGGGEDISVLEIYFHPNYNPKNLRNNLAILRLLRALKLGLKFAEIKKIEIDKNPRPLPKNTNGIIIVGWGAKSSSNIIDTPLKNKLSYAVLDYYPLAECQEVYSKEFVTSTNFCAGFFSKGGGACNHDAGGPGISNGILVGVISFGSPACGAADAPTVFTKVSFYSKWIEKILRQKVHKQHHMATAKQIKDTAPSSFETTTFKIKPIDNDNLNKPKLIKEIERKREEIDTLKMKDKAHFFEEFIATIFDKNEIKEFINEVKGEGQKIKTKLEEKFRDQLQFIRKNKYGNKTVKIKPKGKTKIKSRKKSKTKKSFDKHITVSNTHFKRNATKTKLGSSPATSLETVTASFKHTNITNQNQSYNYEKKLEQKLETLINNLDLDEVSEFEYSSSEILQNERLKDKEGTKRIKSKNIDELYGYLLKKAEQEISKDNYNSNKNENIESSASEESDNINDRRKNVSYESQIYKKGKSIEDQSTNEDNNNNEEENKTNENLKRVKEETGSYETEDSTGGDDNDSTENYETCESSISEEDQSKRNYNKNRGYKYKGSNAGKKSREDDDLETSGIQKNKSKDSKSKRSETKRILRILAKSDDFYDLVAKAVEGNLN